MSNRLQYRRWLNNHYLKSVEHGDLNAEVALEEAMTKFQEVFFPKDPFLCQGPISYDIEKMADALMEHDDRQRAYEAYLKQVYGYQKEPLSVRFWKWLRGLIG